MIERTYTVTYSCYYLDSNPVIKTFDDYYEMQDWISEEVQARLDFFVQHSPFTISEEDLKNQEEREYSLMTIKEL